jgi:hypothetical protein
VWLIRALFAIVPAILIYVYFFTSLFTITSYDIVGVDDDVKKVVIQTLQEAMKGNRFFVIPKNKVLSYEEHALMLRLKGIVPEAKEIELDPEGLHTLKVTITLLTPVLRFGEDKVINKEGVIFTTTKNTDSLPVLISASSSFTTVRSHGLSFEKLLVGGVGIDVAYLEDLLGMVSRVSTVLFPVKTIVLDDADTVTLVDARDVSKFYFSQNQDTKKVWTTVISAIDTEPLKSKLDSSKNTLLYLDVRYGNKVFYKFNEGFSKASSTDIIGGHATTTQESVH